MLGGAPFLLLGVILLKHYEWLNDFCCSKKGLSSTFFMVGLAFLADAIWMTAKFSPSDFGTFALTSPVGLLLSDFTIVISIAICAFQASCQRDSSQSSSPDISSASSFSRSDAVSVLHPEQTLSSSSKSAPQMVPASSVPTVLTAFAERKLF